MTHRIPYAHGSIPINGQKSQWFFKADADLRVCSSKQPLILSRAARRGLLFWVLAKNIGTMRHSNSFLMHIITNPGSAILKIGKHAPCHFASLNWVCSSGTWHCHSFNSAQASWDLPMDARLCATIHSSTEPYHATGIMRILALDTPGSHTARYMTVRSRQTRGTADLPALGPAPQQARPPQDGGTTYCSSALLGGDLWIGITRAQGCTTRPT